MRANFCLEENDTYTVYIFYILLACVRAFVLEQYSGFGCQYCEFLGYNIHRSQVEAVINYSLCSSYILNKRATVDNGADKNTILRNKQVPK